MKFSKKSGIAMAGVTLALVAAISLGAVAMAQPRGNGNALGGVADCGDVVTEITGLTQEEIQAQRLEGKSLVMIAGENGVSQEALVQAITAAKEAEIQDRVAAGTLTQERADLMLQQMEQNVVRAITRTSVGQPEWAGGKGAGQKGMGAVGQGVCLDGTTAGAGLGTGQQFRGGRS